MISQIAVSPNLPAWETAALAWTDAVAHGFMNDKTLLKWGKQVHAAAASGTMYSRAKLDWAKRDKELYEWGERIFNAVAPRRKWNHLPSLDSTRHDYWPAPIVKILWDLIDAVKTFEETGRPKERSTFLRHLALVTLALVSAIRAAREGRECEGEIQATASAFSCMTMAFPIRVQKHETGAVFTMLAEGTFVDLSDVPLDKRRSAMEAADRQFGRTQVTELESGAVVTTRGDQIIVDVSAINNTAEKEAAIQDAFDAANARGSA